MERSKLSDFKIRGPVPKNDKNRGIKIAINPFKFIYCLFNKI